MNQGLIAVLVTVAIWSWPAIFIKFLSRDFDVITQNFFRYLAGSLFLWLYCATFSRSRLFAIRGNLHSILLPPLLVFLFQIVWVQAIYLTTATTATLLSKLDIIFVALLSLFLLKGERKIIGSKYFLAGSSLALLGVVGVVLGRTTEIRTEFNLGVVLLLVRSLLWSCYIISVRTLVTKVDPIVAATWVFSLATLFFLPMVLILGDIYKVAEVPAYVNLILFGSGGLCVGMGNATNYIATRYLGVTIPATLLLLTPFFTGVFSYLIFAEVLKLPQIFAGLLILFGCWVIIRKVVIGVASQE